MNPAQALANRTARLVAEANTPVYTTDTVSAANKALARAERLLCTEDFCFICSRCTDHFGEHSDAQIRKAAGL